MKHLIVALILFVSGFATQAQTNLRTVMVNTNGVVQRPTNFITTNRIVSVDTNGAVANPTNFWTANSNSINSVVSNVSGFNPMDFVYRVQQSFFANGTVETNSGSATFESSVLYFSVSGTNASGFSAARIIKSVNSEPPQGVGTMFGSDSHAIWIRFDAVPRDGVARVVLGGNDTSLTNFADYPTNRAIGFELRKLSGDTNEIRLIAHNGTTNTNGPWVALGTVFRRYTVGVEQNKTSGEVRLWTATSMGTPTVNTNATISGGPTNNAGAGQSALVVGLFNTNTNASSGFFTLYSALVEITD